MSEPTERVRESGPSCGGADSSLGSDLSTGPDAKLRRLCAIFHRDLALWVERFSDHAVEQPPLLAELDDLRSSWRNALHQLRDLAPLSLSGALAKVDAEKAYAAWASSGEGSATESLILAVGELRSFLSSDNLDREKSDKAVYSGASGSMQWLGRFARLGRFAQDQKPSTQKTGLRSQA